MSDSPLTTLWEEIITPLRGGFQSAGVVAMLKFMRLTHASEEEFIFSVDNNQVRTFMHKYVENDLLSSIKNVCGYTPKKVTYVIERKKQSATEHVVEAADNTHTPSGKRESYATPIFSATNTDEGEAFEVNPFLAANLNPKFTFNNFIVGNKNRLSYAAAQAVADSPGTMYNPLYLYGGVGLGKTHLLQAIGNAILAADAKKKVIYVSCENFMNEFALALNQKKPDAFKKKYRNVDVFLIDDIQFVAGRDGLQEEFFHTFNTLHQADKQIVMTSDKIPSDIKGLEERLSSRFSMGMVADMQLPDQPTRQAILMAKCQEKRIKMPDSVLAYISEQIETNIRELEGALTTVVADLMAREAEPTIEEVRISLRKVKTGERVVKKSAAHLLTEIICKHYSIERDDLHGSSRLRELVHPRQLLMYLLKHEAGLTYPAIGKELGGRDHTTIMHGVEKITKDLKKLPDVLEELQVIKDMYYEYK